MDSSGAATSRASVTASAWSVFPVGTKLDAKVMTLDRPARRVLLSVRAKETDEDAQAVAAYGSTSAGASLGDILGAAIRRRQQP